MSVEQFWKRKRLVSKVYLFWEVNHLALGNDSKAHASRDGDMREVTSVGLRFQHVEWGGPVLVSLFREFVSIVFVVCIRSVDALFTR